MSAEEKQALAGLKETYAKYIAARPTWFKLYGAGRTDEAAAWHAKATTPLGAATVKAFSDQIELQRRLGDGHKEVVAAQIAQARAMMIGVTALAVVLAVVMGFMVTRGILSTVTRIQRATTSLNETAPPGWPTRCAPLPMDLSIKLTPVTPPIEGHGNDESERLPKDQLLRDSRVACMLTLRGEPEGPPGDRDAGPPKTSTGLAGPRRSLGRGSRADSGGGAAGDHGDAERGRGAQETSRSAQATNEAVDQLARSSTASPRGATSRPARSRPSPATATEMAAGVEQVAGQRPERGRGQPADAGLGRARRAGRPRDRRRAWPRSRPSSPRRPARSRSSGSWASRSARWSRRSTTSPSRPTCWP